MKLRIFAVSLLVILVATFLGLMWFLFSEKKAIQKIDSFASCEENGFKIELSLPRKCVTPDGRIFTESGTTPYPPQNIPESGGTVSTSSSHELISVIEPAFGSVVTSPLVLSGEARGYWFFEASFPIELRDKETGDMIAVGIAEAQEEWMTEDFVPFTSTMVFKNSKARNGILIFKKDNPSGLPEHDDEFILDVKIGITN